MKVFNQSKLQHPCSERLTDLYQRSNISQYPTPYTYIKEPMHCCAILICEWREITNNFYKNNHAGRHILMQSHLLQIQEFNVKCHENLHLPDYDDFRPDEIVYLRLKAVDHNESFITEIISIANERKKAMPLLNIHHSVEELFRPRSEGTGTFVPCCGTLEYRKRDIRFSKEVLVMAGGCHFKLHPLFDVPSDVETASHLDRICIHLKLNQQHEIRVLSAFLSPVGFCRSTPKCNCEACRCIASTYHFGQRLLSAHEVIPQDAYLYLISEGLDLTCESKNAIFLITCKRCASFQYIGQTMGVNVKERIKALSYEFRNEKKSRLCNHFRQKDHDGIADWEVTIIDQKKKKNGVVMNDLQQAWMDRLDTLNKQTGGLNMNPPTGQKTLLFIVDNKLINISSGGGGCGTLPKWNHHEIVVTKKYGGKTMEEIEKLAPSIIEREKPKRVILHVGGADIHTDKPSKMIAREIFQLVNNLQSLSGADDTGRSYFNPASADTFWISGLLPRDGVRNQKVQSTNRFLKQMCRESSMKFVDHSNIDPSVHFKVDRQMNQQGVQTFIQNIDNAFQERYEEERLQRMVDLYAEEVE